MGRHAWVFPSLVFLPETLVPEKSETTFGVCVPTFGNSLALPIRVPLRT